MAKQIIDNSEVSTRSVHDLGFNWLGTSDFGRIVPFHVQELLGTDKIKHCKPRIELQMLPLVSPTFGKISFYIHYFFVPTRLLWKDFYDFYSQTGEGKDALPPYWLPGDFEAAYRNGQDGSIETWDGTRALFKHWTSFGLPAVWSGEYHLSNDWRNNTKISLLPFRAYNQIWWDFYRDTELIPDSNKSLYLDTEGGHREVELETTEGNFYWPRCRSYKDTWIAELFARNGLSPDNHSSGLFGRGANDVIGVYGSVEASKQLREIEALTRLAERLSLSGKRQIDMLFSQYGIKPDYSKLQMAQYLGGARQDVLVSDITATSDSVQSAQDTAYMGTPLGAKAGSGYMNFDALDVDFTAPEPGYLIGVFSVMPKVHFVQGLGKEWFRNSLYDWFRKELEHTGQVAVPRMEVGINYKNFRGEVLYDHDKDKQTFAFTQPYYDYKRKMDVIAGDFLYYHSDNNSPSGQSPSDAVDKDVAYMNSMGLYINFPIDREYNADNLLCDGSKINKIFYYQGGDVWANADDHFQIDIDVNCVIDRPMDGYAVPTLETTEDPHKTKSAIGQSAQL